MNKILETKKYYMLNYQNLTTSNFKMPLDWRTPLHWIVENFSDNTSYVSCVAKWSKLLFTELLFSNPGDKVLKIGKLWDKSVPYL